MQQHTHTSLLAIILSVAITGNAFASGGDDHSSPSTATSTSTATANPSATVNMAPITVSPTINASPISGSTANSSSTANPIVNTTVSPTITGGNSAANVAVGPVTAGGATLNNVGSHNGAHLNNVGNASLVDNSKTDIKVQGSTASATGTANVDVNVGPITTGDVKTSNEQHQGQKQSNTLTNVGSPIITIEAQKVIPPAAQIPSVNTQAPTLFFNEGKPANATGARLAMEFLKQCPPTFDEVDVSEIRNDGTSGKTRAIFTPHSNYNAFKKADVAPRVRVVMTPEQLPAGKFKCTCLGLLQVEANTADAGEAGVATIVNDAGLFARDKMRGYADVRLVLIPAHAISINLGVDANAKGFGIAPGFSGLLNTVLGTIGANASNNTGRTFAAAQMGATFAVVAGGDIPDGAISIDLGAFMNALPALTVTSQK